VNRREQASGREVRRIHSRPSGATLALAPAEERRLECSVAALVSLRVRARGSIDEPGLEGAGGPRATRGACGALILTDSDVRSSHLPPSFAPRAAPFSLESQKKRKNPELFSR
jgi:hypothetical protein